MIEVYCDRRSYVAGEPIDLHVSTDAPTFVVRVVRSGSSETTVLERECDGRLHATPDDAVERGCDWPAALTIVPQPDWDSGFYKLLLTSSTGETGEGFFVLRAAQPRSTMLWVVSTTTWNAYNMFGGRSTYSGGGDSYAGAATHASFLRPVSPGFVSLPEDHARLGNAGEPGDYVDYFEWSSSTGYMVWTGAASWSQWSLAFARWAENQEIAIDYAVSEDLERFPELLDGYKLMLSVGHDEYWSWGMRDAVEGFIARGGNVAFLSGNTSYWQVRLDDDHQTMVAYKSNVEDDPVLGTERERENTGIWSHRTTRRPENLMTGLSFTRGGYARVGSVSNKSSGGYTVYRPDHWALEGTGLAYGDQLGASTYLVAYECDGCVIRLRDGLPEPTGEDGTPTNFDIIAIAPTQLFSMDTAPPGLYLEEEAADVQVVAYQVTGDRSAESIRRFSHGHAVMGTYVHPSGGMVFNSGTTEWAFGLVDPMISRITRNILDRLSR